MSKTMAEVLRGHWSRSTHTDNEPFVDKCDGCGEVLYTWGEPADPCDRLAAHQAAALSAAGFGLVTDAKAEALEEAADATPVAWDFGSGVSAPQIRPWLRARSAALRGDS